MISLRGFSLFIGKYHGKSVSESLPSRHNERIKKCFFFLSFLRVKCLWGFHFAISLCTLVISAPFFFANDSILFYSLLPFFLCLTATFALLYLLSHTTLFPSFYNRLLSLLSLSLSRSSLAFLHPLSLPIHHSPFDAIFGENRIVHFDYITCLFASYHYHV